MRNPLENFVITLRSLHPIDGTGRGLIRPDLRSLKSCQRLKKELHPKFFGPTWGVDQNVHSHGMSMG